MVVTTVVMVMVLRWWRWQWYPLVHWLRPILFGSVLCSAAASLYALCVLLLWVQKRTNDDARNATKLKCSLPRLLWVGTRCGAHNNVATNANLAQWLISVQLN